MDFEPLRRDFLRITAEIVYCTVTTVDADGRPRSRVMHPIFEVVDGHPRGWAVTDRTPLKERHLAAHPYVACSYWSPAQDTVTIDCSAEWVEDDEELRQVWDLFAAPEPPGGATCRPRETPGSLTHASMFFAFSRTVSKSCAANSSPSETLSRGLGEAPADGPAGFVWGSGQTIAA